jgi:hypothetical protein
VVEGGHGCGEPAKCRVIQVALQPVDGHDQQEASQVAIVGHVHFPLVAPRAAEGCESKARGQRGVGRVSGWRERRSSAIPAAPPRAVGFGATCLDKGIGEPQLAAHGGAEEAVSMAQAQVYGHLQVVERPARCHLRAQGLAGRKESPAFGIHHHHLQQQGRPEWSAARRERCPPCGRFGRAEGGLGKAGWAVVETRGGERWPLHCSCSPVRG